MARLKDALDTILELAERGYSAAYIAGYTGYPIEFVNDIIENSYEGS